MCMCTTSSWVKRTHFHGKANSKCFCWFPAAILKWRFHTKLLKVTWDVLANNSIMVYHTDLRLWEVVNVLVFYNISFSWPFSLNGLELFFFVAWKRSIHVSSKPKHSSETYYRTNYRVKSGFELLYESKFCAAIFSRAFLLFECRLKLDLRRGSFDV